MKGMLLQEKWSPYLAGALVGVLAIASVLVSTKVLNKTEYLGTSTTFVRAAGLVEQRIEPMHVRENAYFQKTKLKIDWQMMLVLGIFLGAFGSSVLGKTFCIETVPPIWRERFGSSAVTRMFGACIGGIFALFGARLAGGCPSGHGLSGMMQLAVSGLIAMIAFMVGGIITAAIIYRKKEVS